MAQSQQETRFAEITPASSIPSGTVAATVRIAGAEVDIHTGADSGTASKKGSVFISAEDGAVYMVKGLFSTWAEMLGESPVLLDAVLIPFRDSIISDGLVVPYRVRFGKGVRGEFKEAYMNAKRNHTIRYSISDE